MSSLYKYWVRTLLLEQPLPYIYVKIKTTSLFGSYNVFFAPCHLQVNTVLYGWKVANGAVSVADVIKI